jgi:thiosulfate/3-mercaptopyruvate sulfurtransferase
MNYTTLISTIDLAVHLDDPAWAIFDARFSLADAERGRRDYARSHLPGAIYAHLNDDLSGPVVPGRTGRHPLPDVDAIARFFSRHGVDDRVQVVAYDDAGGAMAVRVWWLLRWLGHRAVAVLDGGWPKWLAEARPVTAQPAARPARVFVPQIQSGWWWTSDEVAARRADAACKILDARNADRYRGENETIDPVAGHIPGAVSAPYAANLNPDGTFRPVAALRDYYQSLLGQTPAERAVVYCGSGVTAAHNILAMEHAGLGIARLYAGSWSEWITDPARPVATGNG